MTDSLVDDLARASDAVADLVDRITPDQWAAPTPCTEWSVRDVVDHLVGMNLVLVALLNGNPMPKRGADCLGDDASHAFRRSSAALLAAADPESLERVQETRLGVASGGERLRWRIVDLLAHGWDLVQATGIVVEIPDDLAEPALTFAQSQLPGQQQSGRFAEPQPVSDDAPAIDRLAAFTGRPMPSTR